MRAYSSRRLVLALLRPSKASSRAFAMIVIHRLFAKRLHCYCCSYYLCWILVVHWHCQMPRPFLGDEPSAVSIDSLVKRRTRAWQSFIIILVIGKDVYKRLHFVKIIFYAETHISSVHDSRCIIPWENEHPSKCHCTLLCKIIIIMMKC